MPFFKLTNCCKCVIIKYLKERGFQYVEKSLYFARKVSSGFCKDGTEFIFDAEDFERINNYCWRTGSDGYIQTSINGKTKMLYRTIMNAPKGILVDHKHGIKTNNRKSELRFANKYQNGQNHKIYSSNTSGFTGAHFHKGTNKFMARIKVDKNISI